MYIVLFRCGLSREALVVDEVDIQPHGGGAGQVGGFIPGCQSLLGETLEAPVAADVFECERCRKDARVNLRVKETCCIKCLSRLAA